MPEEDHYDFPRMVPYLFLHAGCLLVLLTGWSWFAVGVAALLYVVRMFGVTAFYHRYFSHRAFRTSRWMQLVFGIWANTSMQRGALWWASTHRHHHAHSDEETDKHSPVHRGFIWSHLGWLYGLLVVTGTWILYTWDTSAAIRAYTTPDYPRTADTALLVWDPRTCDAHLSTGSSMMD